MKLWHVVLTIVFVVALAGCGGGQGAPADEAGSVSYTSEVLDASYPDALDVSSQLALGTLRLEGTENAVMRKQAEALLPLWQAIQGGALQGDAEMNAVLKQIEGTMTQEQLETIAAMQVTQEDLRNWMQEQGPGFGGGQQGPSPEMLATRQAESGGGQENPPEMATRRAGFASMSEEEREALRATAQAGGGMPGRPSAGGRAGGRQFTILLDPLIDMLTERAVAGAKQPAATDTPPPTPTPTPTPTPAVAPTATATPTPTEISAEAPVRTAAQPTPVNTSAATSASAVELERIEDRDPAPPLTILVSSVRIEDGKYKVTGTVRNDGSETYEGIGVIGTFFDDHEYRHGPVEARCPCLFLEPGAECPFSIEIYARNYVAYHLHPNGQPVAYRQPAPLVLSNVRVSNDAVGNVRITGTAVNENEFAIKNATIGGALIDAGGQIVSVGSTAVPGELMPGASVPFDLRIKYEPYSHYQLYVEAAQS